MISEAQREVLFSMNKIEQEVVIHILARVSETSYRRGYQQAVYVTGKYADQSTHSEFEKFKTKVTRWRYDTINISRDAPPRSGKMSLLDRLSSTYPGLEGIGPQPHNANRD